MKNFTLTQREIPLNDEYDVIVAGGGPAGCAAAIAAAREGAKTLLIEAQGSLGGMSTMGMVPTWCPFSDREKMVYRGIAEEIFVTLKKAMPYIDQNLMDWVGIDPEKLKRIYDDKVTEAGADVLFNTFISCAESEDGTVNAIIVSNKAGLSAYSAKVFIDCTGDGDVAVSAGAEYIMGDGKGNVQASTHCFELGGVNETAYINGPNMHTSNPDSPIYAILASKKYDYISDSHLCQRMIKPRVVGFNAGHIWDVDNTDPISVSKALIEGRRKAEAYCAALREFHPAAFGDAHVEQTAPMMGIRETRRIIGDYVLTKEDYITRRTFEDEICRNSYYLDIHMSDEEQKETGHQSLRYEKGESHGVPYRCLTPKGIKNLLMAGRQISTDRSVQGSTRVMPVCLAMGEAAGRAAAMACNVEGHDVHSIDVQLLRKKILDNGGYIL